MAPGPHELLILSEPFMAQSPSVMFTCTIANDKNEVDCSEKLYLLHACFTYVYHVSEWHF